LARHLCEINNYSRTSLRRKLSEPTNRIILHNAKDNQIHTEIYVPDPEFQKVEDLVDDNSALEQDLEDYNAQLKEELLHKK